MTLDKISKIKIGLGIVLIGTTAYVLNYILKQLRLLTNTKFDMVGTTVNKVSVKEINVTLWWKVTNYSDLSFVVKEQVYDIYINDQFIKKVGYAEPVDVLAKGTSRIPTYISFTPKEVFNIGLDNLGGFLVKEGRKTLKLKVVGDFTIQTKIYTAKKIPFEFSDTIENIMNY
jgi:LEA14-like dessication related protein